MDRAEGDYTKDGSGNVQSCAFMAYDGLAFSTGSTSGLVKGLETASESEADCVHYTGVAKTTTAYNANGDPISTIDADANGGISGHTATTGACTGSTACTTYDSVYGTLPSASIDVFNQTATHELHHEPEFRIWLVAQQHDDPNGQTTSNTYDALGRMVSATLPGETSGLTTTATSYSYANCPATGANQPCAEVDATQRLNSTTTVTTQSFYDGYGHLAETRAPGPNSQDVIQYAQYDPMGQQTFLSQPYFIPSSTPAGYVTPDHSQPGTQTGYDGLGRVITSVAPNSATTRTSYAVTCGVGGTSDANCYETTITVDPLYHKAVSYADALGRTRYGQRFTGNNPYTLYSTVSQQYDYLGDVNSTTLADGTHVSTSTYNGLDQRTSISDPNLGNWTYSYDPNGNLIQSQDPRGTSGNVFTGYDGVDRQIWISNNSNGSSPFATYTYDSTANGNDGIGELTSETFASGPSQSISGSYAYTYDNRGEQTGWSMTVNSTTYPFTKGYNDAGQPTTLTYPDGDTVTTSYSPQAWLGSVTETLNSTTNTLFNSLSYAGLAGASQQPTSGSIGNSTYTGNWTYDLNLRLTESKIQLASNNSTMFDQTRAFDAAGNVLTTNTTLPAGTDNQAFCYDDLDRLVWAGASGTPPCQSLTAGTLTSAQYQQSYTYDILDRLTTGPAGSGYTYGDTSHLDAVTNTSGGYTASYDSAGDMGCRAPTSSLTCSGTVTGQAMSYDAMRRQISWQNATNSPTTTASYGYNGSGERIEQQVTSGGTTTTTVYVGSYEEISTTGSTSTTIKYYLGGLFTVESINGTLYYLINDGLSSVSVALTSTGTVQAVQLFAPWGSLRYSNGSMPTSFGFTGQRLDTSGLYYFNSRYYDPTVGAFTSVDTTDGLCYTYVHNNPETLTDPSGTAPCNDGNGGKAKNNAFATLVLLLRLYARITAVDPAAAQPILELINWTINTISYIGDTVQQTHGVTLQAPPNTGSAAGEINDTTNPCNRPRAKFPRAQNETFRTGAPNAGGYIGVPRNGYKKNAPPQGSVTPSAWQNVTVLDLAGLNLHFHFNLPNTVGPFGSRGVSGGGFNMNVGNLSAFSGPIVPGWVVPVAVGVGIAAIGAITLGAIIAAPEAAPEEAAAATEGIGYLLDEAA